MNRATGYKVQTVTMVQEKGGGRHGIINERGSKAYRYVSDCGRICGIDQSHSVEAIFLKGFHTQISCFKPFVTAQLNLNSRWE